MCITATLLAGAVCLLQQPAVSAAAQAAPMPVSAVGAIGLTVSDMDRAVGFLYQRPAVRASRTAKSQDAPMNVDRHLRRPQPHRQAQAWCRRTGVSLSIWRRRGGPSHQTFAPTIACSSTSPSSFVTWRRPTRRFDHTASNTPRLARNVFLSGTSTQRVSARSTFAIPIGISSRSSPFHRTGVPLKWHAAAADLFLGIDHTAIVVDDTNASLRFYRDALGMTVVGERELRCGTGTPGTMSSVHACGSRHSAPPAVRYRAPRISGSAGWPPARSISARTISPIGRRPSSPTTLTVCWGSLATIGFSLVSPGPVDTSPLEDGSKSSALARRRWSRRAADLALTHAPFRRSAKVTTCLTPIRNSHHQQFTQSNRTHARVRSPRRSRTPGATVGRARGMRTAGRARMVDMRRL